MPPTSTELVLYQHEASYDKREVPSLYNIPWSSSSPRGSHLIKGDVVGALLTSWGPNLLSTSLLGHLRTRPHNSSGFTIAINVIKAQFILFRRRIDALEAQNDDLRHDNMMCHSDVGALESELTRLRADYYSELFQRRQETRRANEDKEEIKTLKAEVMMQRTEIMILKDKNAQAQVFMQAMLDLKLHDPVLQAACKSVKDGGDAQEALVNAVLKASACKDSAWSRIIPAVVGPRSPEHYLSALDLALKARRDLHERKKVSGFWKLKAMADPSNAGTLTPSSSQISDICEELVQQQEVSKHSISSNVQGIDAKLESVSAPEELPSAETITQMQFTTSKDIQSHLSLPHSIDSVDTQMTITGDIDASQNSDTYSVVADDETDEAYLSSGRESMISTITIKPLDFAKNESVVDDALVRVSESVDFEDTPNTVQESGPLNKELVAERPLTPLDDEVSFSVELSTPNKTPQPSKVSSFLPVTPSRTPARTRSTVSLQSPPQSAFHAKSRAVKDHTNTRTNSDLLVSPVKSLGPASPIRSRLSTPKNYTSKRPVLQSINLNVPAAAHDGRETCDSSDDDDKSSSSHNLRRSSTKNLRKRRGVILVERMDVGDNVKPKSKASSANAILSDSPTLPVVAPNADAFGHDHGKDLAHQVAKDDDFGGHLARDASDVEQSPVLTAVANDAEGASSLTRPESLTVQTPSKSPSSVEVQRPAVPSPTSAIISRFIENFSDSDLGSLEMTEDEDSDSGCENIRRVQQNITPVRPKRTIRYSDEDDRRGGGHLSASISNTAVVSALASSDSTSASVSSAPRSRPATPFSKSLSWLSKNKKEKASLSASSSGSSYTTSTASGSDGQSSKKKAKLPLFGLARRFGRTSTSPPPSNEINISSEPPFHVDDSSSVPPLNEHPSSPVNPTPKPSFWNKRNNSSNDGLKEVNSVTPTKTISPSKIPKSDSAQKRSPVAGLKPSVGQSFIRRLSNAPIPKSKPIPQPTPQPTSQSIDSDSTYLAPPSPQYTKPRSHTINTVSPLPPSLSTPSPQSLMAGSTKPRSHTVNTYSPTTRSPLSRLAGDTSTDVNSTPTKASRIPPGSSLPRSLVPKTTTTSPKNIAKSTATPSRTNKSPAKKQSSLQESEPKPPTAAFMRPAANSTSSTTRRMTNSIAPLIPNWTPSTSNGLTPKQCRSMFRNSLSMVVR